VGRWCGKVVLRVWVGGCGWGCRVCGVEGGGLFGGGEM